MIANASVPRGDTLTRAFGAAEAAKKMRWRLMKSRQLASIEGSCLAMARGFYRESLSASQPHFRSGSESAAKAQKSSTNAGLRIWTSDTGRRQMKFLSLAAAA